MEPLDELCFISSMALHEALCCIPDNTPLLLLNALWLSGRPRAAGERSSL